MPRTRKYPTRRDGGQVEGADSVLKYNPFHDEENEIRLITILPVEAGADDSSQVKCHLDVVSLEEEFHGPAYKLYRSNTEEFKRQISFARAHEPDDSIPLTKDSGLVEDWVEVLAPVDDATTKLPEFRYTWGDYMALSYTWGDPSITRDILLNGHLLRVTENVEACLRVLRGKSYIKKGWMLWIDALCINQGDIIERATQVKRMHEIYKKAWTPIIWLGDELEGSSGAMSLVKQLAHTFTGNDQVNSLTQALHRDPAQFGHGNWRALHQLINRRYWSRMWILQEAAMGRRDTPVLCGQLTLPWIDFSRTFKLLNNTDEVLNKYMKDELEAVGLEFSVSTWSTFATVGEIQVLMDTQHGLKEGNLFRLLHLGRTVFATDARDKVYGILEMMPPDLFALINPDYSASVLSVYLDFAWSTICSSGSLDVLRHRYATPQDKFPSWLPDWNVEPTQSPLSLSNISYSASGATKAFMDGVESGPLLPCKGFKVDSFDGLGCIWSESWNPDTIVQTDGSADPYGSIDSVRDAIWKTLVASRNLDGEPISEDYSSLLATPTLATAPELATNDPLAALVKSNVFEWCVKFLKNTSTMRVCGQLLSEYFWPEVKPGSVDPLALRDALMQRDHITVRRRFVTTEKGHVGMALENVKKGDGIYVLHGCTVPVVLRPRVGEEEGEGTFEYLGECYVHGIMDGETMGKYEARDIVLS